jgi:hypothetical protein
MSCCDDMRGDPCGKRHKKTCDDPCGRRSRKYDCCKPLPLTQEQIDDFYSSRGPIGMREYRRSNFYDKRKHKKEKKLRKPIDNEIESMEEIEPIKHSTSSMDVDSRKTIGSSKGEQDGCKTSEKIGLSLDEQDNHHAKVTISPPVESNESSDYRPAPKNFDENSISDANICVACMDLEREVVLLACKHYVLCKNCSVIYTACPICRVPYTIDQTVAVYKS